MKWIVSSFIVYLLITGRFATYYALATTPAAKTATAGNPTAVGAAAGSGAPPIAQSPKEDSGIGGISSFFGMVGKVLGK